eukprot:1185572-Prorocentrum_minimum.AAC.5
MHRVIDDKPHPSYMSAMYILLVPRAASAADRPRGGPHSICISALGLPSGTGCGGMCTGPSEFRTPSFLRFEPSVVFSIALRKHSTCKCVKGWDCRVVSVSLKTDSRGAPPGTSGPLSVR